MPSPPPPLLFFPPPPIYFETSCKTVDREPRWRQARSIFYSVLVGIRATFKAHGVETKSPWFPRCTPLFSTFRPSLSLSFFLVLPLDDRSLRDLRGNVIGKLGRMSSIRRFVFPRATMRVAFGYTRNSVAANSWCVAPRIPTNVEQHFIVASPPPLRRFVSVFYRGSGDECILRMSY